MNGPITALLVEDNPGDAELTRDFLEESEVAIDTTIVENGLDAIARLRREPPYEGCALPTFILLDLNLPGGSGADVLAALAQDPELRTIPVVVFTSSDAPSDISNSYELGANCYVVKPTGLGAFREAVRSVEQFWLRTARLP